MVYYTENPLSEFTAISDEEALKLTDAKFVYREDEKSENGLPFVILRNEK